MTLSFDRAKWVWEKVWDELPAAISRTWGIFLRPMVLDRAPPSAVHGIQRLHSITHDENFVSKVAFGQCCQGEFNILEIVFNQQVMFEGAHHQPPGASSGSEK